MLIPRTLPFATPTPDSLKISFQSSDVNSAILFPVFLFLASAQANATPPLIAADVAATLSPCSNVGLLASYALSRIFLLVFLDSSLPRL